MESWSRQSTEPYPYFGLKKTWSSDDGVLSAPSAPEGSLEESRTTLTFTTTVLRWFEGQQCFHKVGDQSFKSLAYPFAIEQRQQPCEFHWLLSHCLEKHFHYSVILFYDQYVIQNRFNAFPGAKSNVSFMDERKRIDSSIFFHAFSRGSVQSCRFGRNKHTLNIKIWIWSQLLKGRHKF